MKTLQIDKHGLDFPFQVYERGDEVSRYLRQHGVWEPFDTACVGEILATGDPDEQVVLDFGAHIGWYSVIAGLANYPVVAVEADPRRLPALEANLLLNGVRWRTQVVSRFVDGSGITPVRSPVRLFKSDIEGYEWEAVQESKHLFKAGLVDYALLEISPVFNISYPELVELIAGWGYDVYQMPPGDFPLAEQFLEHPLDTLREHCAVPAEGRREYVAGLHQENMLFEKRA